MRYTKEVISLIKEIWGHIEEQPMRALAVAVGFIFVPGTLFITQTPTWGLFLILSFALVLLVQGVLRRDTRKKEWFFLKYFIMQFSTGLRPLIVFVACSLALGPAAETFGVIQTIDPYLPTIVFGVAVSAIASVMVSISTLRERFERRHITAVRLHRESKQYADKFKKISGIDVISDERIKQTSLRFKDMDTGAIKTNCPKETVKTRTLIAEVSSWLKTISEQNSELHINEWKHITDFLDEITVSKDHVEKLEIMGRALTYTRRFGKENIW